MKKLVAMFGLSAVGALASFGVFAQTVGPDTTSVTTAITNAGAAVAVIGAAVLVLLVGVKVWKWLARAL